MSPESEIKNTLVMLNYYYLRAKLNGELVGHVNFRNKTIENGDNKCPYNLGTLSMIEDLENHMSENHSEYDYERVTIGSIHVQDNKDNQVSIYDKDENYIYVML